MFTLLIPFRDNAPITAFHRAFHCCCMNVDVSVLLEEVAKAGDLWDSEMLRNSLSLLSVDKALSSAETLHIVFVCVCACVFAV